MVAGMGKAVGVVGVQAALPRGVLLKYSFSVLSHSCRAVLSYRCSAVYSLIPPPPGRHLQILAANLVTTDPIVQ